MRSGTVLSIDLSLSLPADGNVSVRNVYMVVQSKPNKDYKCLPFLGGGGGVVTEPNFGRGRADFGRFWLNIWTHNSACLKKCDP